MPNSPTLAPNDIDAARYPPSAQFAPQAATASLGKHDAVWILLIWVFALVARATVALLLPPWQGPDEPKHFEYVRVLVDKRAELWQDRRLVRLDDASPSLEAEIIASMARHHFWEYTNRRAPATLPASFYDIWQGSSTQLYQKYSPYHFLLAAVLLPFEGLDVERQLLVVRLASAVVSASTVVFTYLTARELAGDDPFVPVVSAAFVAALPMHVFMGGTVNNDNMVSLFGAATVFALAVGLGRGFTVRRWLLVGGGLLLAIGAKRTAWGLVPAVVAVGLACAALQRSPRRRALGGALVGIGVAAVAAIVLAPPLADLRQGLASYFLNEPDQITRLFDGRLARPRALDLTGEYLIELHRSFWGVFGWYSVQLRPELYALLTGVTLLCTLGLLVRAVVHVRSCRDAGRGSVPRRALPLLTFVTIVVTLIVISVAERLSYFDPASIPTGRYLFVGIVPIATLAALGPRALVPRRFFGTWLPAALLVGAMIALDLAVLVGTFLPAYVDRRFA